MIVQQLETELVALSGQLRSITVEIANRRGGGSGVIWSSDGLIVTNSHVVRSSKVDVRLDNGKVVDGRVVARNSQQDLAAIKIDANQLPTLKIGNSDLRPGELVLAMGSPWGFRGALTTGVVHAKSWRIDFQIKRNRNQPNLISSNGGNSVIAADIRLAPGSSGGVLADASGRIVGINVAIFYGLALAIPSQQVQDFVEEIS